MSFNDNVMHCTMMIECVTCCSDTIDLPYRTDVKCRLTFMTSVSGWDGLITSTTPNIVQR